MRRQRNSTSVVAMAAYDKQVMTPTAFAALSENDRAQFKATRIIPPSMGSDNFGSIEVTLKVPVYAAK